AQMPRVPPLRSPPTQVSSLRLKFGQWAGWTLARTLAQTVLAVFSGREAGEAMLSHHKLKVYGKGVAVVASLGKHLVQWDKRHAVVDQLGRASESIVLNWVEGVRLRRSAHKQQLLDYAVGSALECAACVDMEVPPGNSQTSSRESSR